MFRERCTGAWPHIAQVMFLRLALLSALDEWSELATRSAEAVVEGDDNGDYFLAASGRLHTTRAWLMQDDVPLAMRTVEDVRDRWSRQGYQSMHFVIMFYETLAHLWAGDAVRAHARVEEEWPRLRRAMLLRVPHVACYARQQRAVSSVAVAHGLQGRAKEQALAMAEREGAALREMGPWTGGRADLVDAAVAGARGDDDALRARLRDAVASSERWSLPVHAAVARLQLGLRTGGDAGRLLVEQADLALRARGFKSPLRLAACFCPLPR
jgi:hypothetical protein